MQRIWPFLANFLFVRFKNLDKVRSCLEDAGIVIRTYANDPALRDCARITIASVADNNRLIYAMRSLG